jgi:hypothetical protein
VQRRLADAHTLGALRGEAWGRQLAEIVAALHAHDVPTVLLKGAFLATRAYPSAAVRPMGDLDLLVPAPLLRRAMDAVAGAGYARPATEEWETYQNHRHPPPLTRPGRLPVELHAAIEPCAPPFTLSLADVWARAVPAETPGPHALALAPEDLLLHLATHMGRSHLLGSSLVRVCDIAMWTERFGATADWDAVVRRATASGSQRFVYTALGLAHRLLAATVPGEVMRTLCADGDDAAIEDAMALLDATSTVLSGAVALTRRDRSAWSRLTHLARALVVRPVRRQGPVGSSAAERGLRLRRDAYRARWRTVAHLLRSPAAAVAAVRRIGQVRRLRTWAEGSE